MGQPRNRGPVNAHDLERACRMYPSNDAAAQALGIDTHTLRYMAEKKGIETPAERHRRKKGVA